MGSFPLLCKFLLKYNWQKVRWTQLSPSVSGKTLCCFENINQGGDLTVFQVWAAPTALDAPAPPSATWTTLRRCPTCLTYRWPLRRPASTAAWTCSGEEPARGTLPTHPPLPHPRPPHPCPTTTRPSRPSWTGRTPVGSSFCTFTLKHTRWDTYTQCWTICPTTVQ